MVLSGGVTADVDAAKTTAGNVSMLDAMSTSDDWSSKGDAVDVKMFSGGGMVSVLKRGILDEEATVGVTMTEVGSTSTLLVNVRVTVMNLKRNSTLGTWFFLLGNCIAGVNSLLHL